MFCSPLMRLFAFATSGCLIAPLVAQTQFQTLPVGFEGTNGSTGSAEPFRTALQQRHHFVYDSGEFTATGPIRIRSIAFRPTSNTSSWNSATYRNLSLSLATSISHYASQSYRPHFDDNLATVPQTIFAGDYTLPSGSVSGTGPHPWVLSFASGTGYVYHPAQGRDLIVQVQTPSRDGAPNPLGPSIDMQNSPAGTLGGSNYLSRTNPLAPRASIYPFGDIVPIARIEYEPFSGVHADFGATRVRGFGPLSVQFTDRSFTTNAASITNTVWDFDNDGVFDSSSPTPSFIYTTPGTYTVRLRVRDGSGATSDRIATSLIGVLAPATSNTDSAEILHFNFDEVRGARCFNAAKTSLAPQFGTLPLATWQGAALRFGFQPNEPGFGCLAADPNAPFQHVVDTQWPAELCGAWTIAWWQRRVGTHGPEELVLSRLGDAARIVTGGTYGNSFVFEGSFLPSFNSQGGADSPLGVWTHYALAVDDNLGTAEWRVNGVPRSTYSFTPGSTRMREVRTMTFGGGTSSDLPFTRAYDLDDLRLYARVVPVPPRGALLDWSVQRATNSLYDTGYSALGPIPQIDGNSAPRIGNANYAITLAGLPPNSAASLIVGFTTHVFGIFPLDLSSILGPGCALAPFPDFSFPVAAPSGSASFASPIPPDPLLLGAHTYAQWLSTGPNLALSPGLDLHIR